MKKQGLLREIIRCRTNYIMLSFWFIPFILFFLVPVLSAVVLSFTDFNMLEWPNFVGFANYEKLLLNDDLFLIALENTLTFAVITGPVGYLLSFVLAWMINDLGRRTRPILTLLFYAPVLSGSLYVVWMYIFSEDTYGLLNYFLLSLGAVQGPVYWLTDTAVNMIPVIVVLIWSSMGAGFLAFIAGFQSLNQELYEAAAIDGVRNRWQELWHITLPQMGPQLLIGAILSISSAFAVGGVCMAMTGFPSTDYSTYTLQMQLYDYAYVRYEMGYASAVAMVLFLIMIGAWQLINKGIRSISGE
ncbi:MAG: sugar ABC transporter permease [Clostridiales bacterium]|nr:sugar ABC transporter permease [Clostridiales bacterium]